MSKRIPYIQQLEISDCGAACLAMSMALHGRTISAEEVRNATGTGRDGVNAASIIRAARAYDMRARGVKVELDGIKYLPKGAILHWEFNHFVVFERLTRGGIVIVDPAAGRRKITLERFGESFTGVALIVEPDEGFTRDRAANRSAWRYVRPMMRQSGLLGRVAAVSLFIQVLALSVPILTGVLVDRIVPTGDRNLLFLLTMGLGAMALFHMLSSFVRAHLLLNVRTQLDLKISLGFIQHLVSLPYSFFLQRSSGDLMMRLNSNSTVREILTTGAMSTMLDGTLVSLYLILIFVQSARMGAVIVGVALLQVLVMLVSHRRNQRLMSETLNAQARSQGYLVQILSGIETLKSVGSEDRAVSEWTNFFVDEVNATLSRGRLNAAVDSVMGSLRVASPLAILGVGALSVLNGNLTLGQMLALNALAAGFLTPLANLVTTGLQMQLLGSYMERINDVLGTSPEQESKTDLAAPTLKGRITLENVSFRYSEGSPEVVKDVSLEIEPGQSIAIVGKSGSGKSTLAHLILGLYAPTSGRVLYDGADLKTLDLAWVRKQLGIVPQDAFLFGSSVRKNIALAEPEMPLERVERAAALAAMHDEIRSWPMGYDTVLADGGASLSGGQRQRLALARALVHDPKILLLDEATSHLDVETEQVVHRHLENLGCTRIVIAHRLSTVQNADLILVMEDGRFVERGTHDDLLAGRGRYWRLVASQGDALVPKGAGPAPS
ncbi:MAG TPA: peptidase domain-containing ABC transporter [Actinomycetota bacterium]|nr:peptidase domain-containing ABC transporter [Actinomycetota bacterium]